MTDSEHFGSHQSANKEFQVVAISNMFYSNKTYYHICDDYPGTHCPYNFADSFIVVCMNVCMYVSSSNV